VREVAERKGIHVLLSSHLLPDVEAVCRDVVVLGGGRVLAQGNIEEMKTDVGSLYVVRVRGDRAAFGRALRESGCGVVEGDRGDLRVTIPEGGDIDLVWRSAVRSGVQVRHLVPSRRSLEDVFLEALEADAAPDGGDGTMPVPPAPSIDPGHRAEAG
jgi:ABC-2 type transport system ATP-binding protein